jgi:oxygen-independent coproporphyrinogen-3 oxidase
METLGLYIHIPFCARKCRYCDFLSFARTDASLREAYVRALILEIERQGSLYGNMFCVNSVFLGGGTPSLLSPAQLSRVLSALSRAFSIARDCETTMEANPGALDERLLDAALSQGVNRLSLGVQALSDRLLRVLGRIHTRADFLANYRAARRAGFANINTDLMFAFPGQTPADWRESLEAVLALGPEHISFYSLELEAGTPMYADVRAGTLAALDEETDREMYHFAARSIARAGYEHYEISNAAKPGFRCRHNLKYWSMDPYLGLGLGAHSYTDGVRFSNTEDLRAYIAAAGDPARLRVRSHVSTPEDCISEYMFLGLRRLAGVSEAAYARKFGEELRARFGAEIARLVRAGLLEEGGGTLRLTPRGIDLSDSVFVSFV